MYVDEASIRDIRISFSNATWDYLVSFSNHYSSFLLLAIVSLVRSAQHVIDKIHLLISGIHLSLMGQN